MVTLLAALYTGCSGDRSTTQEQDTTQSTSEVSQDTLRMKSLYKRAFDVEEPPATAHEVTCIRADFPRYVQHKALGAQQAFAQRDPALKVTVKALKDAVSGLQCAPPPEGPIKHAVIVHHGLLANGQYDAMIQVLCLTYDPVTERYTYPASADGYTVNDQGELVYDATGSTKWYASGGAGERYSAKTYIMHKPGTAWAPYDTASDRRAMAFPYELELEHLIDHNELNDTDMLLLEPYAEASVRNDHGGGNYAEDGYFHGVVWVPVGVTLDNVRDPQQPFKNKAADLGAPCPVNCAGKKFKFWTIGVKPRSNC
jgi:hypothetical protein